MNDLIIQTPSNPAVLFSNNEEFEKLFGKIKATVNGTPTDVTSAKNRDAIKTTAYKISRTKTALDELGKNLTDDWRKKTNAVNASRKEMRERLDTLRDDVRRPLTDWENDEKEREETALAALEEVRSLGRLDFDVTVEDIESRIEKLATASKRNDWNGREEQAGKAVQLATDILGSALVSSKERRRIEAENAKLLAEKEAKEKAENERLEKEKMEAAAREKVEAEKNDELAKAQKDADEAKANQRIAEQRAKDVEAQAKKDVERAAKDAAAQKLAEENRLAAEKAEKEKAEKEQLALKKERAANAKKRETETLNDLSKIAGVGKTSSLIYDAISKDAIRHVGLI